MEHKDADALQATLREAQREVLDQEIFSLLIRDTNVFPTSSVRVSERLLVVEATQDTEIWFELVSLRAPVPLAPTNRF
jgi:mediator of RNA polymerase II transcription subunit 17, fungi type